MLENLAVLLVDDDKTNRIILGELLTRWGMNPHCVNGETAGLAAIAENPQPNKQPMTWLFSIAICRIWMASLWPESFAKIPNLR